MKDIASLVYAPWLVTDAVHASIVDAYERHVRGEGIPAEIMEKIQGHVGPASRFGSASSRGYQIAGNGVAIIPVEGVLSKRMNLMMEICGGASTEMIGQAFDQAMGDPNVRAIILQIDSPGGSVDGTQELANKVFAARGQGKKIVSYAEEMCSGACWIGTSADEVFISSDTAFTGSIGVVFTHRDVSGAEAARGVKTTEVTAGRFKRVVSNYAPLTPDGYGELSKFTQHIYGVFTDAVARNRGIDAKAVHDKMADGRTFVGRQAIDVGLVDGVTTLDALIKKLSETNAAPARQAVVTAPTQPNKEKRRMDRQTLQQEHPELVEAIRNEGHAAGIEAGAEAERKRIESVLAIKKNIKGHDPLIEKLAFDGKTTQLEAKGAVIDAAAAAGGRISTAMAEEAPPAVTATPTATTTRKGEVGKTTTDNAPHTGEHVDLGRKARAYRDSMLAKGIKITATEAYNAVKNGEV
jgi:signal peptide peptidase SppA